MGMPFHNRQPASETKLVHQPGNLTKTTADVGGEMSGYNRAAGLESVGNCRCPDEMPKREQTPWWHDNIAQPFGGDQKVLDLARRMLGRMDFLADRDLAIEI